MKTRSITFSNGLVKDAVLKVPAEACSLFHIAQLIRQSYLEWRFDGRSIMSDEVIVSSIGQANFFAGALGGYETRLSPDDFKRVKQLAESAVALAVDTVKFRKCNAGISIRDAYLQASRNEALSEFDRKFLADMAELPTA